MPILTKMLTIGVLTLSAWSCAHIATANDCEEVGYIATFEVKPGQEAAFEAAISAVASKVREVEPGTLFYAPYRGESGKYFMMERYQNLAAREQHAKAPEVLALFPAVMGTLSAPIDVEPVTAVCASAQ